MAYPAIPQPFSFRDRIAERIATARAHVRRTNRKVRKAYHQFVRAFQFYSTFGFWAIVIGWFLFS